VLLGTHKWKGKEDMLSIVMIGIANELPPEGDEKYELHRLLGALLSEDLPPETKLNIIENEYDIPLEIVSRKELQSMCNLSEGIVERTEERIIMNMFTRNFTLEQIADATEKTVDEVKQIIDSKKAVLV
jgi:hypothetical protein